MTAPPPIAAYDFDGTITRCDSFLLFLRHLRGRGAFWNGILRCVPLGLAFRRGRISRDAFKAEAVRRIAGPATEAQFREAALTFADDIFPRILRQGALDSILADLESGHMTGIVSASPDFLVGECAKRLGMHFAIGTRLAFGPDGHMTGLDGANCWGPEKLRRLTEYFPQLEPRLARAYGDTRGDREMLDAARDGRFRAFHGKGGAWRDALTFLRFLI